MRHLVSLPLLALPVLLLFGSCKKDPLNNLSNADTRIYISNYDSTAIFSSYKTFSVADSVDVIEDNALLGKDLTPFDSTVLATVSQNMKARGYQLVEKNGQPDLAVNVSRVYNNYTGTFSYYDYWNDYYSYYDPYYWGYGGYGYYSPYSVGVYSIQSGGLSIDLLDLKNATSNGNKISSVWSGLARGEGVFNYSNAAAETQALFDQSAYLKAN